MGHLEKGQTEETGYSLENGAFRVIWTTPLTKRAYFLLHMAIVRMVILTDSTIMI